MFLCLIHFTPVPRLLGTVMATIAYVACSIAVVVLYALKRRFIGKITDYDVVT
jgi:hypothetical protein